jgi:hypothetical protein
MATFGYYRQAQSGYPGKQTLITKWTGAVMEKEQGTEMVTIYEDEGTSKTVVVIHLNGGEWVEKMGD